MLQCLTPIDKFLEHSYPVYSVQIWKTSYGELSNRNFMFMVLSATDALSGAHQMFQPKQAMRDN